MARQYSIDAGTYNNLLLDSGKVVLDWGEVGEADFGATRGGNTFSIETEYRDMEVDGARGPVKGSRRITMVTASLTVNMIEMSPTIIQRIMTGADSADEPGVDPTHKKITRSLAIELADYLTNVAFVGEVSGSANPVICILKNPIVDGNFELSASDKDESVIAVTFKAHFDPASMDAEPWEIQYPIIA